MDRVQIPQARGVSRLLGSLGAGLVAGCLLLASCAAPPAPPQPFESPEDAADFRDLLQSNAQALTSYLQKTRRGQNVSEFNLGWLVYNILVAVTAHDQELYDFFNLKNGDLRVYLRNTFRTQPDQQIALLDALRARGDSPLRATAGHALETLRHIPDPHDPPEEQQKDREDLAAALVQLQAAMQQAAAVP